MTHTDLIKTDLEATFVEKGYEILDALYNTDLETGNTKEIGSLIESIGNLYGQLTKDEVPIHAHESELPSLVNSALSTVSWLSPLGDTKPADSLRNQYLMGVNCVVWALYDMAEKQNDTFKRGSMKIVDPDHRLLDLLMGYVQFATGSNNPGFTRLYGANEFAYNRNPSQRLSSHYTAEKYQSTQYGIDARFEANGELMDLFPFNRGHLLFGTVNIDGQSHTFVKVERVGLGNLSECVEHSTHFLVPAEAKSTDRRESQIPSKIKRAFEDFKNSVKAFEPKKPVLDQKKWDINEMYDFVLSKSKLYPSLKELAFRFKEVLKEFNFLETASIRTGSEVILDMNSKVTLKPQVKPLMFSSLTKALRQPLEEKLNTTYRMARPA